MPPRRSSPISRDAIGSQDHGFDERLEFLRSDNSDAGKFPLKRRFEHRVQDAEGDVEAVYWPRRDGSKEAPEQLSLFILGNPGLIDYYLPFLAHLYSLLPPTHAILCTSHIGHEAHLPAPKRPAELSMLLETKIELVTALRTSLDAWSTPEQERTRLVLIGHSLGGWLVCEIMKRLNKDEEVVDAGHLLFPSLGWMAKSWNGRVMWPLFTPLVINTLPTISYLLRPILPFTRFPNATLNLLRSPTTIQHVLQLARSELEGIQAPDFEWISSQITKDQRKGLFGVWSAGNLDGWVGEDGPLVQHSLGGAKGGRVRIVEKVPHAFCLSQAHSELIAGIVAGWMTGKEGVHSKSGSESESDGVERGVEGSTLSSSIGPM